MHSVRARMAYECVICDADDALPSISSHCMRFPAQLHLYPSQSSLLQCDTPLFFHASFAFAPRHQAIRAIFPAHKFGSAAASMTELSLKLECEWEECVLGPSIFNAFSTANWLFLMILTQVGKRC